MRAANLFLICHWAALMALSLAMGFAGDVTGLSHPGALWLVIIACIAAIKARIVLRAYLGLFHAPGALAGFSAAVVAVLALVAVSFLIFPTPARISGAPVALTQTFAGGIE